MNIVYGYNPYLTVQLIEIRATQDAGHMREVFMIHLASNKQEYSFVIEAFQLPGQVPN